MIFLLLSSVILAAEASPLRICVPQSKSIACESMVQDLHVAMNNSLSCVIATDTYECLQKIEKNEADVTNTDASGIYAAGQYFNLQPILTELLDGDQPFRYQGIAVISKESSAQSPRDLKGLSSCHTGLGRTTGWKIPLGRLLSDQVMQVSCSESELAAVQSFFNGSCVPGIWSKDKEIDRLLKESHRSLCSRCKDPSTCGSDDAYAGYEGALRCLSEGSGEVAFTKEPALREYLKSNPEFANQAEILCYEGGRRSVLDKNMPESCFWGHRPNNAFVTRGNVEEQEDFASRLLSIQSTIFSSFSTLPKWFNEVFLSYPKVTSVTRTPENRRTYSSYLGDFIDAVRRPRPSCDGAESNSVTFCVTSSMEDNKCQAYARAAKSQGLWPDIKCVTSSSKVACMHSLKEGYADLLTLDGNDVYKAGRYFNLQPIASELYGELQSSYYAVAVIRSSSDVTKLSDLRGLRSCHTGMGRTAGWAMPVGALLSAGLLSTEGNCSRAEKVADFFSAGSCVPGARDPKYNPGKTRSDDLCRYCIGDEQGQNKCSRGHSERYSSYSGAFRCLAEGAGDVAFVKHTTALDNTDGKQKSQWARDLRSDDFALLCDGGGTDHVSNYSYCNLGRVPAHQVVMKLGQYEGRRLNLARLLADSSSLFSKDSSFYQLFNNHKSLPADLLFKDSATGLRIVPFHETYEQVLGKKFIEACRSVDPKECAV